MKYLVVLGALAALPAAAQEVETATQLLAAARLQIAVPNLDSAAALIRRVADVPAYAREERVQAWVLLGIVDFYRQGDSAAAHAFRQALSLDPALRVATLDTLEPAIAQILAAERAALGGAPGPAASPADAIYDCLQRCPEGVRPPRFASFPRIDVQNAGSALGTSLTRGFLAFHAVIDANGAVEAGSVTTAGGTARGMETELREALPQARFQPGRSGGAPVRTRVVLRFDFHAEGTSWIRYTYRVVAR